MLGVRAELAGVIASVRDAIFTAVLFFFILFLLRLVLRKEWIAGTAFVSDFRLRHQFCIRYTVGRPSAGGPCLRGICLCAAALWPAGRHRHIAVGQFLALGGVLDFSAWYAGMALMPFLLVALLVVYGFRTSLAGRKLFSRNCR